MKDDEKILEVPPGTTHVYCAHLKPMKMVFTDDAPIDPNAPLPIDEVIVWLEETPSEIGYHGICPKCGKKYFARVD